MKREDFKAGQKYIFFKDNTNAGSKKVEIGEVYTLSRIADNELNYVNWWLTNETGEEFKVRMWTSSIPEHAAAWRKADEVLTNYSIC